MPEWIYVLAACAVGWVVFVAVFHPFRRGAHAAPRALPVRVDAGSMTLAEERTIYALPWPRPEGDWLPTPPPGMFWPAEPLTAPLVPLGGQLGPRAREVLDRYNARCVERWGHAIAG